MEHTKCQTSRPITRIHAQRQHNTLEIHTASSTPLPIHSRN